MSPKKEIGVPITIIGVFVIFVLSGCSSFSIHNSTKSDLATSIKTKYESTNVLEMISLQRENLAALSAEEITVVRDNLELQRDYALLEIAVNYSPMGETWNNEINQAIEKLGFKDAADLRRYVTGLDIQDKVRSGQMDRYKSKIFEKTGVKIPACNRSTPLPDVDGLNWPTSIDATKLNLAKDRYKKYTIACSKLLAELVVAERGTLLAARDAWKNAEADLKKREKNIEDAKDKVNEAVSDHKKASHALTTAGKKGEELRKSIKEHADTLKEVIEEANELAPNVVTADRISAIMTLLMAAAGEDTDLSEQPDDELSTAVLMVNGVSSISADISALVANAKVPSISNLLIELQHQTALLERERALQTLQQERIDILKAKYLAYLEEAKVLLSFRDALCSFGYLTAGKDHPGTDCDKFRVAANGKQCMVDGKVLPDCGLAEPWKKYLAKTPKGEAGREFYKGLAAFSRLFSIRSSQIEQNFKLIDLKHRENLVERESALKVWNNLAVVPIDQIDAYYKSGLTPEEISDLIVKALGFTAITIGVSQ